MPQIMFQFFYEKKNEKFQKLSFAFFFLYFLKSDSDTRNFLQLSCPPSPDTQKSPVATPLSTRKNFRIFKFFFYGFLQIQGISLQTNTRPLSLRYSESGGGGEEEGGEQISKEKRHKTQID